MPAPKAPHLLIELVVCAAACASVGCEPDLVVGSWGCLDAVRCQADRTGCSTAYVGPLTVPWSTDFEEGLCDYARVKGYCYAEDRASYELVSSPVHGGEWAMAFTVDTTEGSSHTRCVVEGQFPSSGYYSAWYLLPDVPINSGNWNLVHFQGGTLPSLPSLHNLLDVSVESTEELDPRLYLFNFVGDGITRATDPPLIPIGDWFHIEIYWKRAADMTGEVALYQDGDLMLELTDVPTDDTDWAQLYVGNLATNLMPRVSTVYVDDVEIRETR